MFMSRAVYLNRLSVRVGASILSTGIVLLAGCGAGPVSTSVSDVASVAIGGHVHGGQNPVTGSHVALFATTSAGYNGTLTAIATTTTDGNGNFSIPSGYTCPSTQQAYLVATGGNPGLNGTPDNSAIFLVAALGPCSSIGTTTEVVVNEVTTVAAAFALRGFFPAGGVNMDESHVEAAATVAMPGATTSSTNTQGLTDGFANANNIVATYAGMAYTAPPSDPSGVVPQATINALGNILQSCVNQTSATTTACLSLFNATTPPPGSGSSTVPVNIFQAALNIAQYPGNGVAALYALLSGSPAFQPYLTAAPNDWTIGVTYNYSSSTVLKSGLGMGIDNYDNVYITGSTADTTSPNESDLVVVSPQGALGSSTLMGTTSTANNIRWIAFDSSNNAYMANGNAANIYKFAPSTASNPAAGGTLSTLSYTAVSGTANNYALAVDQDGDVWTEGYKKNTCAGAPSTSNTLSCSLVELPVSSLTSPAVSFPTLQDVQPGAGGARGLAFDTKTGNIWATDINNSYLTLFNVTPSTTGVATASAAASDIVLSSAANTTTSNGSYGVAVDAAHNAWVDVTGTGLTTTTVPAGLYKVTTALSPTLIAGGNLATPQYLVIDGSGNIFIANNGSNTQTGGIGNVGTIAQYSPAFGTNAGAWLSPAFGFSPSATYTAGVTATGAASVASGAVTGIALQSGGSGYTSAPLVTLVGGGGTGATATATVSGGAVTGFTIVNAGSGYTSAPTVTVAPGVGTGSLATGTAAVTSGSVSSISVSAGGSGYTVAPGVTITGGGGTGATATATVSGGAVTGFTVTNGGSGYTSAPTVTVGTLYGSSLYLPAYVAVDRSGALWSLSSGSNGATSLGNLIQILGVAAPTDPVQADGNYGVKP